MKYLHYPNPASAILTFVNIAVSAHILISKQPIPSPPPLSTLNKLDYCNSLYYNLSYSQLNRLQQIQNCLARAVFKAPKHTSPIPKSLHWLKINQRIEYKILSLIYEVLTTAQPGYLRNLISVDSPHIETHSSSSVALSRPSSSSSLKITDRSFRYASPCLWNKLPASFRQPNPDHSFSHSS